MALELIGGAAVGAVFGELARACMDVKDMAVMFRPTMDQLEDTIKSLEPVIKEIELYNHELNRPESEIESLIRVMEGGKKLLRKCSRIRRWYDVRKVRYQKKLVALDKSLLRFLNVDLQAQMARNQMQMLLLFRSTIIGPDHRGHQDLTVGMTISQIGHTERGLMTLELVGGAVFGDVFGELVRTFMEVKDMAVILRPKMEKLEVTLNSLAPVIKHIKLAICEMNRRESEIESLIRTETITITFPLIINVQCNCTGCCQDFIIQRQIEVKAILKDGCIKQGSWAVPSDLWQLLNQQSETVCKVKRLMVSSSMSEYKYTVVRYEDPNILGGSGASRVSAYDKIESNIKLLAVPAAADETSTANRYIIPSFSISEDLRHQNSNISSHSDTIITGSRISEYSETERLALPPPPVRYQNSNSRMITTSRNPQQYQRSIMPTSSAGDQNSWRISEYDESNKNTLCEGRNHSHIERVALPLPSDEISDGKHEKEYEKIATQHGSQIMQRLHVLEGTSSKMKLLIPAIVILGCFNLVISFLVLMFLLMYR